jgi:hypothetical protein
VTGTPLEKNVGHFDCSVTVSAEKFDAFNFSSRSVFVKTKDCLYRIVEVVELNMLCLFYMC